MNGLEVTLIERNPVVVMLLCFITCGLYGFYWLWATTTELRDATGREDLSPALDLLLSVCTLGLWGIYAAYRNAGVVHEELESRGSARDDRSALVLLLGVLTYAVGFAWMIGAAVLQEELNALARALPRGHLPPTASASAGPMPVTY